MAKWVYLFKEGNADMRNLLGGKGANLAEMTNLGLPVPQGFTITTEACTQYYEDGRVINDEIMGQIMEHITKMEEITGKKFGDKENPLLVSVRSGARASMPGMMDTILNPVSYTHLAVPALRQSGWRFPRFTSGIVKIRICIIWNCPVSYTHLGAISRDLGPSPVSL